MPVKVVGHDSKIAKNVTCRNCSAILEYLPKDVQTRTTRDYTGCSEVTKYVSCPECGNDVIVETY